ncbi:MAG: hypothetical protein ABFD54_11790 [Armatimonadota bacterium]|nr:hypothetical protein [bacterium]
MAKKLAAVGWQGITLKVPEDWSLVGVDGDAKKGYFRVDGPVASALEVRWSSALGKKPDLLVKGREYLSGLEKTHRKKRLKFSSKVKLDDVDSNSANFVWRSDTLGQGRLIYCSQCDRVIIAQIVSARDDDMSGIAPVMLGSIVDHREDGWTNWALFGLEFAVPPGYVIKKQTLASGYLLLTFQRGKSALIIERWGLAATLLSTDTIEQWYKKDAGPDIKGYHYDLTEHAVAGHEGIELQGRRSGIKQAAKAVASSFTLHPFPGLISGYAWYCEPSNRLFGVRATHVDGDDVAERVRDTIKCHKD